MPNQLKAMQKLIRQQARLITRERAEQRKAEATEMECDTNGRPIPKNFEQALQAVQAFLVRHNALFDLVAELEKLLPKNVEAPEPLTLEGLRGIFLENNRYCDGFNSMFGMSPPTIALVCLDEFMKNAERFEIVNPNSIPEAKDLQLPYAPPKITHTTVEIGGKFLSVPIQGEFWVRDKLLGCPFIIEYGPSPTGGVVVTVDASDNDEAKAVDLIKELKLAILKSPYIKGQIIEITSGSDFHVVDIGEQPHPIISKELQSELEKNVINLFEKKEEFDRYGLPVKRSVILAGPPGCGKTMIERWLAAKVRGKVTTIWVTAKSITSPSDVASVFEMARKLSPSLVIMEDLDLISGTRNHFHGNALGEMLNQLDGLTSNDSLVLVGSTNRVSSLDEALADRPGRFDRVYEVGKPESELAKLIAQQYLEKRGVSEATRQSLDYASVATGEFTGAQIVEVVKGAIFEAIHRRCEINDVCLKASSKGLQAQRRLTSRS